MADTVRTKDYLLNTSFPENTSGEISAQDMRDLVVSSVLMLSPEVGADFDADGHKITNLPAPGDPADAARKTDVDTVQGNLTTHNSDLTAHGRVILRNELMLMGV